MQSSPKRKPPSLLPRRLLRVVGAPEIGSLLVGRVAVGVGLVAQRFELWEGAQGFDVFGGGGQDEVLEAAARGERAYVLRVRAAEKDGGERHVAQMGEVGELRVLRVEVGEARAGEWGEGFERAAGGVEFGQRALRYGREVADARVGDLQDGDRQALEKAQVAQRRAGEVGLEVFAARGDEVLAGREARALLGEGGGEFLLRRFELVVVLPKARGGDAWDLRATVRLAEPTK